MTVNDSRRLARSTDGTLLLGDSTGFVPLSSVHPSISSMDQVLHMAAEGSLLPVEKSTAVFTDPTAISFGSPLQHFGKLWGIGLNYLDHASDLSESRPEEPASFMKPSSAVTGPGGPIRLPSKDLTRHVTGEAEIAVVIGRTCKNITIDQADRVIAGYLPVIDMTSVDILEKNPRFLTRAKSFDTFLVMGPWIETGLSVHELDDLAVTTEINGNTIASNTISNMAFSPAELVAFHSRHMTLQPGDIISTGTPGAGRLKPGDTITSRVEEVGSVTADVV
jgi:2-keto-4-pentenoate hydratase/2-oxohepta-3-ene-1,7-dioic acid hydratase in catechol pathway